MNTTVKSKWTSHDEALLLELTERKQRIMEERRGAVRQIVQRADYERWVLGPQEVDVEAVTDSLIAAADALRDALAPFDSGVRTG